MRGADVMPAIVTGSPSGSTPLPGSRSLTVSPETTRDSRVGGSGAVLGASAGVTVTVSRPGDVCPVVLTAT